MQDFAILEDSKIIQDDDKFLVVKALIASEIMYKYKDGMAYKTADELEKAAWTAEGRWVKALSAFISGATSAKLVSQQP